MTQYSRRERYQFPESYSLTSTDEKYFEMVYNETDWNRKQEKIVFYESKVQPSEQESIRIDQHGAPDSNSLTEADREYFNIIKTEDGLSQFFKTKTNPLFKTSNPPVNADEHKIISQTLDSSDPKISNYESVSDSYHSFKYHIITQDKRNKNKKPIVGIYL